MVFPKSIGSEADPLEDLDLKRKMTQAWRRWNMEMERLERRLTVADLLLMCGDTLAEYDCTTMCFRFDITETRRAFIRVVEPKYGTSQRKAREICETEEVSDAAYVRWNSVGGTITRLLLNKALVVPIAPMGTGASL